MSTEADNLAGQKKALRALALTRRAALPDREGRSRRIGERVLGLPAYRTAGEVLCYLDARAEVRTADLVAEVLRQGKKVVVPYCVGHELELFHLEAADELAPGAFRIPEPRADLRSVPAKAVAAHELDLLLVPGVAFDRVGGRLGHGFGYYDRLLERVRPDAVLVGLAFECQLVNAVPAAAHDVFMDLVVTEVDVYPGRGRSGEPDRQAHGR